LFLLLLEYISELAVNESLVNHGVWVQMFTQYHVR